MEDKMMKSVKRNLGYLLTVTFSLTAALLFSVPAYLGVEYEEITAEYAHEHNLPVTYGVQITNVIKGKGAEKAGLEVGDIILEIDNQKIENGELFQKLIAEKDPDEKINIKFMRDGEILNHEAILSGKPMTIKIKMETPDGPDALDIITAIPSPAFFKPQDSSSISISGMYLQKLNPDLGEYFGVKDGYLVVSITKDSGADKAGFKAGDVLQSIDDQPVTKNSDFEKIYKTTDESKEFKFKIIRKNKEYALQMKSDSSEIATLEWFCNPLSYKILAGEYAKDRVHELELKARMEARAIEKEMQKIEEETKHLNTEEAKKIREEALADLKERQKEIEKEMHSRLIEVKLKDVDELNQKLESDILKKIEQKIKDLESKMRELEKKLQEKEIRNK
jgi:C-terminal processing protease CtpA/Prc